MNIQSAFNSGVQGFQNATETANKAAADIVASTSYSQSAENFTLGQQANEGTVQQSSSAGELPDLNQSIVELKVAEHQAKASAHVIKSADENLGTLLDVSV